MADEPAFPVSDEELFARARAALGSQGWKVGPQHLAEDVPLRIGARSAVRRAIDGRRVAYGVEILVDPVLGVPCAEPDAKPRWGSSTVLYLMLDEHGEPLQREEL